VTFENLYFTSLVLAFFLYVMVESTSKQSTSAKPDKVGATHTCEYCKKWQYILKKLKRFR